MKKPDVLRELNRLERAAESLLEHACLRDSMVWRCKVCWKREGLLREAVERIAAARTALDAAESRPEGTK